MKKTHAVLALLLASSLAHGQAINGIQNQVMSGFAPGVGGSPILSTANNYYGNTAAIATQIECLAANCPSGEYVVILSITPTVTSTAGTISVTLGFTDSGQAQSVMVVSALALTTKVPSTVMYPLWSTGTANITWSTSVAAVLGSYSYDVHVRLLKLS